MFSFSTSHNRLLENFSAHPKSVTLKSPRSRVHPAYRAGLEYGKSPPDSAPPRWGHSAKVMEAPGQQFVKRYSDADNAEWPRSGPLYA